MFVAQGLAAQAFPLEGGPALLHLPQPLRKGPLELREPRLLQRLLRARPLPLGPEEAFLLLQPFALLIQDAPLPQDRPDPRPGLECLAAQRVLPCGELLLPREERSLDRKSVV